MSAEELTIAGGASFSAPRVAHTDIWICGSQESPSNAVSVKRVPSSCDLVDEFNPVLLTTEHELSRRKPLSDPGTHAWIAPKDAAELAREVLDSCVQIFLSEWADPNQRCAAVTVALALIVDDQRVTMRPRPFLEEVSVVMGDLRLDVPKVPKKETLLFPILRIVRGSATQKESYVLLDNLAVSYGDHERNLDAIRFLGKYWPQATDQKGKAAVLGLAWARLQRHAWQQSFVVSPSTPQSGGLHFSVDLPQGFVGIQVHEGKLIGSFPGL